MEGEILPPSAVLDVRFKNPGFKEFHNILVPEETQDIRHTFVSLHSVMHPT